MPCVWWHRCQTLACRIPRWLQIPGNSASVVLTTKNNPCRPLEIGARHSYQAVCQGETITGQTLYENLIYTIWITTKHHIHVPCCVDCHRQVTELFRSWCTIHKSSDNRSLMQNGCYQQIGWNICLPEHGCYVIYSLGSSVVICIACVYHSWDRWDRKQSWPIAPPSPPPDK